MPIDGRTAHGRANAGRPTSQLQRAVHSWECDDCGWIAHNRTLPSGRTLRMAIEGHGQYCARPPA